MAQSWSLSVLGWVPGIITMVVLRPGLDQLNYAFGKSGIGYESRCLNVLLIGFQVFASVKILNTLSHHFICTVAFSAIAMSLPRTLHVSFISIFSAFFMCLGILVSMILVWMEDAASMYHGYNGNYPEDGPVETYAFPLTGTTFVATINAILFPFLLKFSKALAILTASSNLLFIVPPVIGFSYLGQHSTAPALGILSGTAYNKSSFVVVPALVIGGMYANVSVKFIYHSIMGNSPMPTETPSDGARGLPFWR
ncbi:transmembrane amino acid transporter [Colletotrichum asianum]|uniref:Transmembrane amino acid transporter n=1 Tax=Colletotrichum asianum TaxID=702518 RepID=A0A8H3W4F3_9PEZI|nr:transmembrane amino acid transporter [Colletotrichum asianum]